MVSKYRPYERPANNSMRVVEDKNGIRLNESEAG
jgi:hypothetical protein